jgi:HD-GYP domain-containing protein (c-di-GMP phosphodiesterase class II)
VSQPGDGQPRDGAGYVLEEMIATSRALSSERDPRKLLAIILEKCRQVTGADAGSVYVVEEPPDASSNASSDASSDTPRAPKRLRFMLSQNDSIRIDFQEFTLDVDDKSIVGQAVLNRQPINIADLAELRATAKTPTLRHNRSFDDKTGYRARSMLTVPMLSAMGEVIGVVQLINKKRDPGRPLGTADLEGAAVAFDARSEELALAWVAQAGLSLENALLYDEILKMFDGFVDAAVIAIESRDPTTSGHSRRVATLSRALAEKVDGLSDGPLAPVRFTAADLQQIEYAGVLHDFGKVGVRERVLVKAKKLYEEDRRLIKSRFAYIKKSLELEHAQRKLRVALELGKEQAAGRLGEIDGELGRRIDEVDEAWAFVERANEPTLLDQGGFERLVEIARMMFLAPDGELRPYLEPEEVGALQVRRGSLTDVERLEIERHVVHTEQFLRKIPWGRRYADVPRIAAAHHQYMDGTGYPRRAAAAEIPVASRILTIADIFDALTASDRPYKKAVPIDRALGIIDGEVQSGKCDADLFRIFVEGEVYKKVI